MTSLVTTDCYMDPPKTNPRYFIMSANIVSSLKSSTSYQLHALHIVYKERLIKGEEHIRLVRALLIESEVVWKTRSLCFTQSILYPKLVKPYTTEKLILAIHDHIPLGVQQ